MNLTKLINKVTESTGISVIRPVDLDLLKDLLMETEEFNGVIIFNVIHDIDKNYKATLFESDKNKFSSVVNIHSIQLTPSLENNKTSLLVLCDSNTILDK